MQENYTEPYKSMGYSNREHYLHCLAEDFNMPYHMVLSLAELLGPNEDFDGLVTSLDDWNY